MIETSGFSVALPETEAFLVALVEIYSQILSTGSLQSLNEILNISLPRLFLILKNTTDLTGPHGLSSKSFGPQVLKLVFARNPYPQPGLVQKFAARIPSGHTF